jgi:hypothetical protein
MNADVLTTRVADGIAVITLGSAKRIYSDEEMGDALTAALDGFAGDANVRVVVVTGGAPGYSSLFHRCAYPLRAYFNPDANRYRYKLDGLDRDWIEVGSDRRVASYTTLPAGKTSFT